MSNPGTARHFRPRTSSFAEPRQLVSVAGILAAIALLAAALALERQLWHTPAELTPLWLLVGAGLAFTLVVLLTARARLGGVAALDAVYGTATTVCGRVRWTILAAAVLAEVVALALFRAQQLPTSAWCLHLLALVLYLVAVWPARSQGTTHGVGWSRADWLVLGTLAVIALAPRVWRLDAVPAGIWFDEAQFGIVAQRIIQNSGFRPIYVNDVAPSPAGYWYLMVPSLLVFGPEALGLRLPAAIGGALGVGAVYLLGRVLFDRRVGLIAAALTLGLGWHLNFSRIAFHAIWSVALDALAMALFVLGLRTGRLTAFAGAGLAAGIGVHFYYPSRLVPLLCGVIVVYRLLAEGPRSLRQTAPGLALFGLGFVLAVAPLGHYASMYPEQFSARMDAVSVFREVREAGSWEPLWHSLRAHALMFNVRGDPNGRHNWTGRPMLDEITGALAVLGLGLALARLWKWEYGLLLAWLAVMLSPAVFSLSWEAPQSLRGIDAVTAVVLMAALPLAALWKLIAGRVPVEPTRAGLDPADGDRSRRTGAARPRPASVMAGLAVLALVSTAGLRNVERYFGPQQHDNRTWSEFSTPQTEAARAIRGLPSDATIYIDPTFSGSPTIDFVVDERRRYVPFDASMHVPPPAEAAGVFVTRQHSSSVNRLVEIYPHAALTQLYPPAGGEPALYSLILSPEDLRAVRGVAARYERGETVVERHERQLSFGWPTEAPLTPPFQATWYATLAAPTSGAYRFRLEGPMDARLVVNGVPVAERGQEGEIQLAAGNHALRVEAPAAGERPIRALWAVSTGRFEPVPERALYLPVVPTNGLLARLYRGREPVGAPALQRIDPTIELRPHIVPLPRPYTVEWSGAILASRPGTYRFGTTSQDASWVWVDGQPLVSNTSPNSYLDGAVELTAGWHDLRVRFLDATSFTHITLFWQPPGTERTVIPSSVLRPWPAEQVAAADPVNAPRLLAGSAPTTAASDPRFASSYDTRPSSAVAAALAIDAAIPVAHVRADGSVLRQPRGVAMGSDGTIYAADASRKAVIALPRDGGPAVVLGEGQLGEPAGVAVLPDGSLAVVDAQQAAVLRLVPGGGVGERLAAEQSFYSPRGISATPDGWLVVADTGHSRVVVLPPGQPARVVEGLDQPTDAAFLPDGNLLVAETGSRKLTVVQLDGQRVSSWPMPGASTANGPHLAVLGDGSWIVTAPERRELLRMTPGDSEPRAWLADPTWRKPVGLAAGKDGIAMTDAEGRLVVLLSPR